MLYFEALLSKLCSRGVPDRDFQNPAGTGFTGLLRGIRPDNPASFCRIFRPEPDFPMPKVFHYSSEKTKGEKNKKETCFKRHLTVLQSPDAEHLHLKFVEKIEQSEEGDISSS